MKPASYRKSIYIRLDRESSKARRPTSGIWKSIGIHLSDSAQRLRDIRFWEVNKCSLSRSTGGDEIYFHVLRTCIIWLEASSKCPSKKRF